VERVGGVSGGTQVYTKAVKRKKSLVGGACQRRCQLAKKSNNACEKVVQKGTPEEPRKRKLGVGRTKNVVGWRGGLKCLKYPKE